MPRASLLLLCERGAKNFDIPARTLDDNELVLLEREAERDKLARNVKVLRELYDNDRGKKLREGQLDLEDGLELYDVSRVTVFERALFWMHFFLGGLNLVDRFFPSTVNLKSS